MRYYAVGDIHGSLEMLDNLLIQVDKVKEEGDQIVFLGDYVDRGPDSFGVIELLSKREGDIFLCGNHDEELRRASRSGLGNYDFYNSVNDNAFIRSYEVNGWNIGQGDMPDSHKAFYGSLYTFYDTEHAFFVHAGVDPFKDLLHGSIEDYLWIRAPFLNWHGPFAKTIVHGHSITKSGKVEADGRKISVDTGVRKNSRLSCAVIEDGNLIDVIESIMSEDKCYVLTKASMYDNEPNGEL